MGPFELTDLIGQDVNEAVTRSVWEAFFHDPKFTPSLAQRRLVESGRHGRKSGRGWYRLRGGRPAPGSRTTARSRRSRPRSVTSPAALGPARRCSPLIDEAGIDVTRTRRAGAAGDPARRCPAAAGCVLADGALAADHGPDAVQFDLALDYRTRHPRSRSPRPPGPTRRALAEAVGLFQALGKQVSVVRDTPGMIVARTVAMLVDFAADAVDRGVATAGDMDTAMRLGVNYPRGAGGMGRRRLGAGLGAGECWRRCTACTRPGRYAPSLALRRRCADARRRV